MATKKKQHPGYTTLSAMRGYKIFGGKRFKYHEDYAQHSTAKRVAEGMNKYHYTRITPTKGGWIVWIRDKKQYCSSMGSKK